MPVQRKFQDFFSRASRFAGVFCAAAISLALATAVISSSANADVVKPHVETADTGSGLSSQTRTDQARAYLRDNPISPPDTASPRATLESFRFIMSEVTLLWSNVRTSYEEGSNLFFTAEQKDQLVLLDALIDKAEQTLDLSEIPQTVRDQRGIELVLQLQEILDRIPPVEFSSIPGETAGTFRTPHKNDALPETWTIPGTSLKLARQTSRERSGHYLFSSETVERIPGDYAIVSELPLRADRGEDLFAYYIYTPGKFIAPRWYEALENGPAWLHRQFADQAYWQWIAFLGLIGLYAISFSMLFRWNKMRAVSIYARTRRFKELMLPITVIGSALLFRYLCEQEINITGTLLQATGTVATAVVWTATSWLVYRVLEVFFVLLIETPTDNQTTLDASLLRTGYRTASLVIALVVLGYGATQIGIPVYGVIAGLGVGGLAIALAAQPTIENLIGGIILYADRMVRVGEFCQFDDLSGTVESIGIRSTRIRALDRTLITIANADLAKRKIVNYSYRDKFHFRHKIGLRYETSPEIVKDILDQTLFYLDQHEKVGDAPLRVRLISFDDYAQTVEVYAYVSAADMDEYLETQQELLFAIHEIIADCGSDFAFPSSTVYLGKDKGIPAAEAEENPAGLDGPTTQAVA